MAFPFRFYGHDPDDWHEAPFLHEIAFREAPSPELRRKLVDLFERRMASGPAASIGAPWLWSGRFARFEVGERWPGAGRASFAQVASFLQQLNSIAPLSQVILLSARERGRGAWELASVQTPPEAGPPYATPLDLRVTAWPRPTDGSLPVAAPDPAAEEVARTVRHELASAKERLAVARASAKNPMSPFPAERVAAFDELQPRLDAELLAEFDVPAQRFVQVTPPGGRAPYQVFADGDEPIFHPVRPCAVVMRGGYPRGVAYLDDAGERREVQDLPPPSSPIWNALNLVGPWVAPEGDRLWMAVGADLYEVAVEDGRARPVHRGPGRIHDLVLGPRWVMLAGEQLLLLEPPGFALLDAQKSRTQRLAPVFGGELVMACDFYLKKRMEAWAPGPSSLKRLAVYAAPLRSVREIDGQVVCAVGGSNEYVSLDGLEQLLERWRTGTARKPRKRKAPADPQGTAG